MIDDEIIESLKNIYNNTYNTQISNDSNLQDILDAYRDDIDYYNINT